ncbi:MAG: toll/interleukin-1 receptor domain-containing protein, partial [Lachnospiraceae bacterium]|nr:toll/interleukin-1 receptor domain-containing protein [Lachnospiraceae bacterium]
MNHIFISYSRKNEALVSECVKRLRAKNIEVWQDVSGSRSGIPCSVKWRDSIEEAIYGSACAVIFKTEAWEASGPCHKEEEMLAKLAIPRVSLSIASDVLGRPDLVDWIVGTILTKYDKWRQDPWFETRPFLLSRIYRLRKGARFREVMDRSSIHERKASTLLTLKNCSAFAESQPYKESFPELLPEIDAFLKKGRNAVLKAMAIRAVIGFLGIAGIIVGRTIWAAYEQVSGQATVVFLQNAAMEIVNETAEYDPVSSMSLLTSENWFSTDPENVFLRMNYPFLTRTMSGLLKENYPVAIEENGNQDLFSENGEESPDFEVTASETDGMLSVLDRRTGVLHQMLLNGPASAWAFSEDGDFMAVSSCENAYVV